MASNSQQQTRPLFLIYREFVAKGIGGNLENPLTKTYGGSILGEKFFVKQALSRLKEGVVSRKETSHRRLLESTVYHRVSKAVEENRTLRNKVGKIISALS